MAENVGLSCPICLNADEPGSMVEIAINHGAVVRDQVIRLCWRCAGAIAVAYRAVSDESDRIRADAAELPEFKTAAAATVAPGEPAAELAGETVKD
jgi:hypothetical protein